MRGWGCMCWGREGGGRGSDGMNDLLSMYF